MSSSDHDHLGAAVMKTALWVVAWMGTVSLADVQIIVSILSGLAVGGLALRNLWLSFSRSPK